MTSKRFTHTKASYALQIFAYLKARKPDHGYGATPDQAFEKIAALDPTSAKEGNPTQYSYLNWVCQSILKENPRVEDLYKIKNDLTLFIRNNQKLEKDQRSIGNHTIESLADAVFPYIRQLDKPTNKEEYERDRLRATQESTIIYDGPEGRILSPQTTEASQFWGRGTKWCISATESDNLFENYIRTAPILMFLPKGTQEKFAISLDDDGGTLRDAKDRAVRNTPDILKNLLASAASRMAETNSLSEPEKYSLQMMLITRPELYHAMLDKDQRMPEYIKPEVMLEILADANKVSYGNYSGNEKWKYARETDAGDFISHPHLFGLLMDPRHASRFESLKDGIDYFKANTQYLANKLSTFDLGKAVKQDPERAKASVLEVTSILMKEASALQGYPEGDPLDEQIRTIMSEVPRHFWNDPIFSHAFLKTIDYAPTVTIDVIPEAYLHPDVVAGMVEYLKIEDASSHSESIDPSIWTHERNGVPFFESLLPEKFERLADAWYFYELTEYGSGVDYAPLIERLNTLLPNGFKNIEDLDESLLIFENLDFSTVLERTLKSHPEFFDLIPPERQTDKMAQLAVAYDPEMLIEIADRLIIANPDNYRGAFNSLAAGNPIREARAHYFTDRTASDGSPKPSNE